MNYTHFTPSQCAIGHQAIPQDIADKILLHHIIPLNSVQDALPFEVIVSQESCYRPYIWEIARGRNGKSEHTFGERENKIITDNKGACDITCEDYQKNSMELLLALIKHTDYKRLAIYYNWNQEAQAHTGFIHADYKDLHNGKRPIFVSTKASKWTLQGYVNELTDTDIINIYKSLT